MIKIIELKNIKPNPFNARTDYADEPINELAKEIGKVGFWTGALRGRQQNGKIELCFGHRRLAALKKLGHKEIEIDIVELSDEEMAMQGLAENLQRQGLNDMEKAEGIKQLVEMIAEETGGKETAYEKVRVMLGYQTADAVRHLIAITDSAAPIKKAVREKKIKASVAIAAEHLGGAEMVKTAIEKDLSKNTIEKLAQSLNKIPDEKVKAKIKAQIVAGKITDPKEIEKKAEPMLRAKQEKGKVPPDLLIVIARWTRSIKEWQKALREVIPYRDYLDTQPKIASEFRTEVKGLIEQLEKLL